MRNFAVLFLVLSAGVVEAKPPKAPPVVATRPPKAPPVVDPVKAKECPCSPQCTCGCNDGQPCTCLRSSAPAPVFTPQYPMTLPAFQMYTPAPAFRSFAPAPSFQSFAPASRSGSC